MVQKIYSFVFPVGGGTIGAVSRINLFELLPTWEVIVSTVVLAGIGAFVGYMVKLILDKIFCKDKKTQKDGKARENQ